MLSRLGLACMVGVASLLAGCSGAEQKQRALRIHFVADPISLDPGVGGEGRSQMVLDMLFEGLSRLGKDGKPELALAEAVEVSDDFTHYRFTLRDTYWSHGAPVTAHDFEYAWKRVMAPDSGSSFGYAFYVIRNARAVKEGKASLDEVGVKALDDKTLEIDLEFPCPFFTEMVANTICSPLCKEVVEKDPHWAELPLKHYITNGPFRLVEWRPGSHLVFEKNPNYWDSEIVRLEKIEAAVLSDSSTVLALYEKGQLDWCGEPLGSLPSSAVPELARNGVLRCQPYVGVYWLDVNTAHPPLTNKKVRQALAYSLDRNEITEHVLQSGQRGATSILPSPMNLGDEPHFPTGDLATARKLLNEGLAELGMTLDQVPAITISLTGSGDSKSLAEAIQQQWQEGLGLPIHLRTMDWTTFFNNLIVEDFDLGGSIWIPWYLDPIYNLEALKYPDNGINVSNWQNSEYTHLLDQAQREPNPARRMEYLAQAQGILLDELPIIPVYYTTYRYLANPHLKDVFLSPLGGIDFRWAYLD